MKTDLFNYYLPKDLLAQEPVKPRDSSRLLVFNRKTDEVIHDHFYNLGRYLKPGDVLVLNNSKVFPARLWGRKPTRGKIEVFLLKKVKEKTWEVLIGGKGLKCKISKKLPAGIWQVRFNYGGEKFENIVNKIGVAPTPPYIKQKSNLKDYQTIYAKKIGSVAAPTAGFHFTKRLINKLKKQSIQFEYVTLHVGYGTFAPVKVDDIEKHKMHPEFAEVDKDAIRRLVEAKKQGLRIVAVGTTSVRVLESVVYGLRFTDYSQRGFRSWINTFIYPGWRFKFVDAMITNFHLPKSTLLILVAAFLKSRGQGASATQSGVQTIKRIYRQAIKKKYRFYSFGDGMLVV
jgi:S-adenosylmethionine:tRNA ribosyltransferase-isomerase